MKRLTSYVQPLRRKGILALALVVAAPASLAGVMASSAAPIPFADKAFEQIWTRTDSVVASGQVARSWYWGPEPGTTLSEPYAQGPGGRHLVQYFDKARMEINNPGGDRNSEWFVTTGLLVVDMVSGKQQVGNSQFVPQQPAEIAVVGDGLTTDPDAPTYTSFRGVSSVNGVGSKYAPKLTGQTVTATINRAGQIGSNNALGLYPGAKLAAYSDVFGHNIPQAMWDFLNLKGNVVQGGKAIADQTIANWVFVMGYPISEPYWTRVRINGVFNDVLVQLFERRTLSYVPAFEKGWQVQMGNVGQHYFRWIYGGPLPTPLVQLPTATPTLPAVPNSRDATVDTPINNVGNPIHITASGFQPDEEVATWFTRPDGTVKQVDLGLVAGADGKVGPVTIQTTGFMVGQWSLTFHGKDSNHESVAFFYLLPPAPVPSATATRTSAPVTPTATRTTGPTSTPGSPTATRTPTRTPVPAQNTPTRTPTPAGTQAPRGLLLSVRPGYGSPSTEFTFIASGLNPNEPVHVKFTTPSGATVYPSSHPSGQYQADSSGKLQFSLVPSQEFSNPQLGNWLWEVDADQTGQQGVVGFTLR